MTIKRLDHVSVVVDDLAAAIAFFTTLGMTVEGEMPVEGPWVDRVNGLESVQGAATIVQSPRTTTCIVTRSRTSTGPCPSLWPGDLRNDGISVAAAGADGGET